MLRHGFRARWAPDRAPARRPTTTDASGVSRRRRRSSPGSKGSSPGSCPTRAVATQPRRRDRRGPIWPPVVRRALDAASAPAASRPTVYDAMLGAGYDRTFAQMPGELGRPIEPARCAGGVQVDAAGRIELELGRPPRPRRHRQELRAESACALVAQLARRSSTRAATSPRAAAPGRSASTRQRLADPPRRERWLATSGIDRRSWLADGEEAHHLIDPACGRPWRATSSAHRRCPGRRRAETTPRPLLAGASRAAAEANARACRASRDARRPDRPRRRDRAHEDRPDLLDPRPRERHDGLPAAHRLGAAGLVLKTRPFPPLLSPPRSPTRTASCRSSPRGRSLCMASRSSWTRQ